MLSLLLVDDEVIIADSLYQTLQEAFQDRLVVRRCYSSAEAKEILEKNRVDILMTDIEMPDVSGLELHKWVLNRWPMIRVIYLTGYSDFAYARRALHQHAMAYVLKSEGDQVIIEAIEKAMRSFEMESSLLLEKATRPRALKSRLHRLMDQALHGGAVTPAQLAQAFEESGAPFRMDMPVLLGYCYFDPTITAPMFEQSTNLIEELMEGRLHALLTDMTARSFSLLCQPASLDDRHVLCGNLEAAQTMLEAHGVRMTACVLDAPVPWAELSTASEQLFALLNQVSPADGELLVLDRDAAEAAHASPSFGEEWSEALASLRYLYEYLFTGQADLYFAEEERLFALAGSGQNKRQAEAIYTALAMFLWDSGKSLQLEEPMVHQLESIVASRDDLLLPLLQSRMHQIAVDLFEARGVKKNSRQQTLMDRVNDYIAAHLSDDLSLTTVADAVHLHPVYLSRIYKEASGVSLSDRIARQRLDAACALLRQSDSAIAAIASATGFASANYFSRWFRKWVGVTPQQYRDGSGRANN